MLLFASRIRLMSERCLRCTFHRGRGYFCVSGVRTTATGDSDKPYENIDPIRTFQEAAFVDCVAADQRNDDDLCLFALRYDELLRPKSSKRLMKLPENCRRWQFIMPSAGSSSGALTVSE